MKRMMNLKFVGQHVVGVWDKAPAKLGKVVDVIIREITGKNCDCRKCINRRSRAKGRRKQNLARKKLGIKDNRFHGADAHEENWATGLRVEVKAGKQCNPLSTFFYKCKKQSDDSHRAFGGLSKPFIQVSMPDNSTKGIVSFELDDIENVCVEALKNLGYEFGDK